MLEFGTVKEVRNDKALAIVNILGRDTDWLPLLSDANSFKKHFIPLRVGQQVCVLDDRLILGGLFYKGCDEPSANNSKEIIEYEDGTKISYDTKSKELSIEAVDKITIICKDAFVKADDVKVKAKQVIVDSKSIDLGKDGKGVVTGECICALTGKPHFDFSQNTRSAK